MLLESTLAGLGILSLAILGHYKKPKPSTEPTQLERIQLAYEVEQLKKERDELISFNSHTRLSFTQERVLDEYDRQGIKIPIDIIDDIVGLNIIDRNELYTFIENQRKNWKNEHMKRFTRKEKAR